MKIELPGNNKEPKNPQTTEKKAESKRIRWRKRGNFICATINGQYVSISLDTYDVVLKNGFKISAHSVEEAKSKAKDFLGYKE